METKKYIRIAENNHDKCNYIKVYFDYDLGGYNYFTHRQKPRGYYLTVVPVERGGNLESFTAFTGVSECIKEVSRKSAKAEQAALALVPEYEKKMVDYIANKYGYILED